MASELSRLNSHYGTSRSLSRASDPSCASKLGNSLGANEEFDRSYRKRFLAVTDRPTDRPRVCRGRKGSPARHGYFFAAACGAIYFSGSRSVAGCVRDLLFLATSCGPPDTNLFPETSSARSSPFASQLTPSPLAATTRPFSFLFPLLLFFLLPIVLYCH